MKKWIIPLGFLLVGLFVWWWTRRGPNGTLKSHLKEQTELQRLNGITSGAQYDARPALAAIGLRPLVNWFLDPLNPEKKQGGIYEEGVKSPQVGNVTDAWDFSYN
jgi:prepilin signal peptidase PulO-like enzyme (type II secretory pathway)